MNAAMLTPLLQGLASGGGGLDPAMAQALMQVLATALSQDGDEGKEEKAARRRLARERMRRLRRLSAQLERMEHRNLFVAGALGACECWGADQACGQCGGWGTPGFFEPEPAAFEAMITPLAQRRSDLLRPHVAGTEPPGSNQVQLYTGGSHG